MANNNESKESPDQRSERLRRIAAIKLSNKLRETPYGIVTQEYKVVNGHITLIETSVKETDL
ncbi:MAG: hypothetical protein IT422_05075 [Pirellulaceae bacterium]|nr:hypothetical protein [Pirellulaceae bacterium]